MRLHFNNIVLIGLATAIWLAFCIVYFLGFDGQLSWVAFTLFGLFAFASFMLWKTVLNSRVAPLELMFWLYNTNFLLLPAIAQSMKKKFYWSPYIEYNQNSLLYACFTIFIGMFMFIIGVRRGCKKVNTKSETWHKLYFLNNPIKAGLNVYIAIFAILIGLLILIYILGPEFYLSSRTSKLSKVKSLQDFGFLLLFPRALALGILIFSIALLMQWRQQRKQLPILILAVLFCALGINAIINFPLSVPRFWIFGFVISFIWIATPLRKIKIRMAFVIALTVMQFSVFPWYSQITRDVGGIEIKIDAVRNYLLHGDFDGFQSIVNSEKYIKNSGYELGRNLISTVFFFVPRSIWNKAKPLGTAASEYEGYEYTNLSAPIYCELYADFGIFSLILGMALFGFGISILDSYYDLAILSKKYKVNVLITAVLAGYLIILMRGSLLGVVPSIATLLGTIFLLSCISKNSKKVHSTLL